ncbi:MAG: hypothetical protein J3R72DRAFT_418624 [Linnemannia gamsii]|nr:MAG: hypothetical protein J3R72DRAFT_418624 [Linnemannia gamsii]
MRVNLLLNAMVVMAATVVSASAAPANTTAIIGLNNLDPVNDSHSFLLAVQNKYNNTMPLMPTTGMARKIYLESPRRLHPYFTLLTPQLLSPQQQEGSSQRRSYVQLVVADGRYNDWVPYRPTTGKKSNGYKKVRKLNDGLWSVEHTDYESQLTALTAMGRKYPFKSANRDATVDKSQWYEYFHCIEW